MRDGLPVTLGPTVSPELMAWLSPAFPVGSFAYSQGLEHAAHAGLVTDRATLQDWLEAMATCGSLHTDLIVLAQAWRATLAGDLARLADVNGLAVALQPSAERHLETTLQGNAFVTAIAAAWLPPGGPAAMRALSEAMVPDAAYPVAVGAVSAAHQIVLDGALVGYALATLGNATSAAIRLSVIGQTDGQRVIAGLMPLVRSAVREAAGAGLDDLGSATFMADISSMLHETQYTRLFRS